MPPAALPLDSGDSSPRNGHSTTDPRVVQVALRLLLQDPGVPATHPLRRHRSVGASALSAFPYSRWPESLRSYQDSSGRALMPCSRMLAATTEIVTPASSAAAGPETPWLRA